MMSLQRLTFLFSSLGTLLLAGSAPGQQLSLTHGVASGDVTETSAIVWARASGPATMEAELRVVGSTSIVGTGSAEATTATDLTAQIRLADLAPATDYAYSIRLRDAAGNASAPASGRFTTAPDAASGSPVSFVVSGDLGGQRYCRRVEDGYPIFGPMTDLEPDFFVANGDMIYADGDCPAQGPGDWRNVPGDFPSIAAPEVDWTDQAQVREVYLDHWRYNRADRRFQEFLARVPMYAQWDDHEVINDFGAPWQRWTGDIGRPGYPTLVNAGLRALFDFHPMSRSSDEPFRIYRSFRWGQDLELFILDARSYRSLNDLSDRPESAKTMLGAEQLAWLIEGLITSDATWKVVSTDVPLSIPTGWNASLNGRDAWASGTDSDYSARTGFESELLELVRILDARDVVNVVFVVTDVHFAASLRYRLDADGDGDMLLMHELVSGPLSAVRSPGLLRLDPTLRPVVLYAEGDIFNFSYVRIGTAGDGTVHLRADVRDEAGEVRYGSSLDLAPEPMR